MILKDIFIYLFWHYVSTPFLRKGGNEVRISKHAFQRADQRGIPLDLIAQTLQTGEMKRFGKNRVKFEKKFKKGSIVCVDEWIGNKITIVTIERKD